MTFRFDHSYLRDLPGGFLRLPPDPAPDPALVVLNAELADDLGLDPAILQAHGAAWFSGAALPPGADPAALAYAGHQFGGFSPVLGDGRAHLLGEFLDPQGRRWDLHLKGSGRTPFSRGGDGKAVLGPMLREYLISEAMAALSVPTTRSLAVVTTGETVIRDGRARPGAVVARVAAWASGAELPAGADPAALAYAGHQFGGFSPQLGDGRAHLLGEILAPDGRRWDLQLKGSGRTPFSRGGDGKAALGPMLREYLISEAMAALGIPTTRSLAVVATGEDIWRDAGRLPGAVLARVAASHIRVGTFQFFAARQEDDKLRALLDYTIARHFPQAEGALGLFDAVVARQARLLAQWMGRYEPRPV